MKTIISCFFQLLLLTSLVIAMPAQAEVIEESHACTYYYEKEGRWPQSSVVTLQSEEWVFCYTVNRGILLGLLQGQTLTFGPEHDVFAYNKVTNVTEKATSATYYHTWEEGAFNPHVEATMVTDSHRFNITLDPIVPSDTLEITMSDCKIVFGRFFSRCFEIEGCSSDSTQSLKIALVSVSEEAGQVIGDYNFEERWWRNESVVSNYCPNADAAYPIIDLIHSGQLSITHEIDDQGYEYDVVTGLLRTTYWYLRIHLETHKVPVTPIYVDVQENLIMDFSGNGEIAYIIDDAMRYAYFLVYEKGNTFSTRLIYQPDADRLVAGSYTICDDFETEGSAKAGSIEGTDPAYTQVTLQGPKESVPVFLCVDGSVDVSYTEAGELRLQVNALNPLGYQGTFTLTFKPEVTALPEIANDTQISQPCKQFRDGQFRILRNGKVYTVAGL